MTLQAANPLEEFQWSPQPQAERWVQDVLSGFLSRNRFAATLAARMKAETGTRFYDWVDTLVLPDDAQSRQRLTEIGYQKEHRAPDGSGVVFMQPAGIFPRVLLHQLRTTNVMLKVESVADFASVWGLPSGAIQGQPLSRMRMLKASAGDADELWVIERHGSLSYQPDAQDPADGITMLAALERFRTRRREFDNDEDGFAYTSQLIDEVIESVGRHTACDLFFAAEREYWQRRNRAAQVQKARQDKLGLGWANHDHHTYRCSRQNFHRLVAIWEKLGFQCRERFYAGREAGWGAQVMEQWATGITTFNDVDLTPDELMGDFSHDGLAPRHNLGTVGLWCALHGDSFLQAGMHHLEAQFDFESLRDQLEREEGVKTMKPFTNFTYLRQAFTEGERWSVDPRRIERARQSGYITAEQAMQFASQGAIGSHLENLERNEGFKGFNQTGVSEIISATDPRKQIR